MGQALCEDWRFKLDEIWIVQREIRVRRLDRGGGQQSQSKVNSGKCYKSREGALLLMLRDEKHGSPLGDPGRLLVGGGLLSHSLPHQGNID